jgi:hypothetical protein
MKKLYICTLLILNLLPLVGFDGLSRQSFAQTGGPLNNLSDTQNNKSSTSALTNATSALTNATSALTNATSAINKTSNTASAQPSTVNATQVFHSLIDSNLPSIFIMVIFLVIIIPLVFDMYLAYKRKPKESLDKESSRVGGMPGLYRALMTFGVILLVGTVIFYLLALITININNSGSPILQSLIDLLKNLGTILGTALATIIAFYFGMRGAENAAEKGAAGAVAAAKTNTDNEPPKVLNTFPADGATDIPVNSLVTASFSEPVSSSTISSNTGTFTVKKTSETDVLPGTVSLSTDGKTAIFDASPDFEPDTKYVATIDTTVKDIAGNALASTKTWSFTTIAAA